MKRVTCPRCEGRGSIDEDETLIGLSPFQDRPSKVNDDEWPSAEEPDPTRVQQVPSFTPAKTAKEPVPAPRPPADLTRIATDSERPTAVVQRPRHPWWPIVIVVLSMAIELAILVRR